MHSVVKWQDDEQITAEDLTLVGTLARESFDFLVTDAISVGVKFSGFNVSNTSATALNIGAGRLYKGGLLYANADQGGVALDLTNYLPIAAGNTKVISVIAFGTQADTDIEPRTYLLDTALGTTEARATANQNERHANVALNANAVEGPSPLPPAVAGDQCEIARIVCSPTGVVSITYVEANRLSTVDGLDQRADSLELWRVQIGARINTLASDISNLAASIEGLPGPAIFQQVVGTLARVQQNAKVPASALNFHFDNYLTYAASASDNTNAAYLCTVQEGIRFAPAAQQLGILQLLNPLDPKVKAGSGTGIMLPDYSEAARVDTIGSDGDISVSQYQFQNLVAYQQSISREVINFGTSVTTCTNNIWWRQGSYNAITGIFTRAGETYRVDSFYTPHGGSDGQKYYDVRLTQFSKSTMTDTYTAYKVSTVSVNGSILSQTFLNSQAGWLTSVDIAFTKVAASGDVKLLICATNNGAPDFTQVYANTTVTAAALKLYPQVTNFPIPATYLDAGNRYAVVLVTAGNHFVSYVSDNKYAQGSLFISTDGAWSQGDLVKDMAFRANFAKFTTTVCQLQMASTPFQLANGITDISLLYGAKIPDNCQLVWEFQINGIWYPMQSYATGAVTNPLLGLPPLVPVRVTFVGTTDLMPAIDMTQTQTLVSRPRGDFTHTTPPIMIGASSSLIRVETIVDSFDPAYHTVGVKLTVAGADVSPSTTTTVIDPSNAARRTITNVFSLGAATTSFIIKTFGTTSAVTKVFHVESRFDYES